MNHQKLKSKALWVRQQALMMCVRAGKGHLGGAFSCTELLVALYYTGIFRFSKKYQKNPNRDRLIFSKGHASLALYPILADRGFFGYQEIENYGKNGSILGGHPDHLIPGVEVSTGSLGHGLGISCGLALAAKLNKQKFFTIVVLGDGECNEGSVWEAVLFASSHGLGNLIAIIDNNSLGAFGFTKNFIGENLAEKWQSFGWEVNVVDGHDFVELDRVFSQLTVRNSSKPAVVIANTVKGCGVSYMEKEPRWHHGVPRGELLELAKKELGIDG